MFYDNKTLAKMKTAELEEIIALFVKAGVEAPEKFANNAERITFIEDSTVAKEGYPFEVTEDWLKDNQMNDPDIKVGDVIFVPAPTEEDVLRDEYLAKAAEALAGLDEDDRSAQLTELAQLETKDLINKVDAMVDANAAQAGNSGAGDDKKPEDEESADEEEEAAPSATQASTGDVIADAIATGQFKYEGTTIIAYSVNVFAGAVRYELHGADRCTYTASKEEVEKIVNSILK